jgi:cell division transport system permease protein
VRHALREAIAAFRRAPVLTGLSAAMVALALFVVGLFGLAAYNLRVALVQIEERVEVVAYLRDDATEEEIALAREELGELDEVDDVLFVSKDEALDRARRIPEFDDAFTRLDVNPLPASLEIRLSEGERTREGVDTVTGLVGSYPFVEEVEFGREWVERLFALRRIAGVAAGVMGAAFALVAALIIGTALKIAIFARRDEIYVMRLVGARDGFIRRPFLLEGAFAGLLGGVLALLLTWLLFRLVHTYLFEIAWLPPTWAAGGVVSGAVFGVLASGFAVRRHLREV